jgi:hypothetical protein
MVLAMKLFITRKWKRFGWQIGFGSMLVAASAILYLVHYLILRDVHDVVSWALGSLAFLPISVLFVTLVIDRLLRVREMHSRLDKLNMVIGAFFSEVGMTLLSSFSDLDPSLEQIRAHLVVRGDWSREEWREVSRSVRTHKFDIQIQVEYLEMMNKFLTERRGFLLRLLENPNLLEHETFTDLLRAVFHLTEELGYRNDLRSLPDADYAHLAFDTKRAYALLVSEWLDYMRHLRENYPYLFSLAIRTNPFDQNASPIVQ